MKTSVYKNYTQAELDDEYNNRAKVSNFSSYMEEASAFCRAAKDAYQNMETICFDDQSGLEMDVIHPTNMGNDPVPVQIFFHGGYWKALSKNEYTFVARAFADHGIATAIVDYGLIPAINMTELIRQCRQSIAYIFTNANRLQIRQSHIHISGHSAGGHIAAMCFATNWTEFNKDLPNQIIRSAVGISGLYDLLPISKCFLQADLDLSANDVKEHSPVLHQAPKHGQFHSIVGSLEGAEYEAQSSALHTAWPNSLAKPSILSNHDHFSIVNALANPASDTSTFIRNAMGQKPTT